MDTELNLLMLEDDPADAELIQRLLNRSGIRYTAKVASNEKEFFNAIAGNGFGAVLANNALPIEEKKVQKEKELSDAIINSLSGIISRLCLIY